MTRERDYCTLHVSFYKNGRIVSLCQDDFMLLDMGKNRSFKILYAASSHSDFQIGVLAILNKELTKWLRDIRNFYQLKLLSICKVR